MKVLDLIEKIEGTTLVWVGTMAGEEVAIDYAGNIGRKAVIGYRVVTLFADMFPERGYHGIAIIAEKDGEQ